MMILLKLGFQIFGLSVNSSAVFGFWIASCDGATKGLRASALDSTGIKVIETILSNPPLASVGDLQVFLKRAWLVV